MAPSLPLPLSKRVRADEPFQIEGKTRYIQAIPLNEMSSKGDIQNVAEHFLVLRRTVLVSPKQWGPKLPIRQQSIYTATNKVSAQE